MNGNGIAGTSGVPIIIPDAKFEFSELQVRQVLQQVKKLAAVNGGQLPVIDPLGLLTLGLILDKLNDMSERLMEIEKGQSVPIPASSVLLGG